MVIERRIFDTRWTFHLALPCNYFSAWNAVKSRSERVLNAMSDMRLAAAKMKHLMHLDAAMTRSQTRLQKLKNNN